MYLSNVNIAGFRGIKSIDLRLGATTVLVGENDWGKASLFLALEKCLGRSISGAPTFDKEDLHCADADTCSSIRVELTFRENAKGEFDDPDRTIFSNHSRPSGDRRSVRVVIQSDYTSDGPGQSRVMLGDETTGSDDGIAALELCRRLCPLLVVRPDRGLSSLASEKDQTGSDQRRKIEHQIETAYDKIVSARHPLSPAEIDTAVADVGELLHEHALKVMPEPPQAGELLESLGRIPRQLSLGGGPSMPVGKHGSATQAISLLVLAGALLHARGPRALDAKAMPIVLIEEPEAHLHPTLLAGVWGLIQSMNTQRVVTTYSGDLLAHVELHEMRRLDRKSGNVSVHRVMRESLDEDDRRRLGYHIRALRGSVLFARTWILIEGETEFWLIPELARLMGHDLMAHGVRLIEFAQCGIDPIAKLANDLGVDWLLMTDGDAAGDHYISIAKKLMDDRLHAERLIQLEERDIEHHLFEHGFAEVYRTASGRGPKKRKTEQPSSVIHAAIEATSKPDLALSVIEYAEKNDHSSISQVLTNLIEHSINTSNPRA